ncbi:MULTISPECIES: hypothetical protein [Comamonadaceae]|uniref:hypothetical protein n=1 Tax=Acidovorax sacchari TaxID=3230736 RepID=UPI0034A4C123
MSGGLARMAVMLLAMASLAGCAGTTHSDVLQVRIPVPVACREPVPGRPSMPTEALRPDASLDDFARAAMAEIERREGYEGRLAAALEACRMPAVAFP